MFSPAEKSSLHEGDISDRAVGGIGNKRGAIAMDKLLSIHLRN